LGLFESGVGQVDETEDK